MPDIDMDAVVRQTLTQLASENALLRLELNATRAALDAATKESHDGASASGAA